MKFAKLTGLVASALFLAWRHRLTVPFSTSNATGVAASHAFVAIITADTHPLKGSGNGRKCYLNYRLARTFGSHNINPSLI